MQWDMPSAFAFTGSGIVAASSKFGGILGALLGVMGLFDQMAFSGLVIMAALVIAAFLLQRHGIDTRGIRLEDMHAALEKKSDR